GVVRRTQSNGTVRVSYSDGTVREVRADGAVRETAPDGTITGGRADGTGWRVDAHAKVFVTDPDGTRQPGVSRANPWVDGSDLTGKTRARRVFELDRLPAGYRAPKAPRAGAWIPHHRHRHRPPDSSDQSAGHPNQHSRQQD